MTNVEVIEELYKKLVDEGIEPENIVYLSYYRGQIKAARIHWTANSQLSPRIMNTVDVFQGDQAPVIILDTVAGCSIPRGIPNYVPPSAHVKNPNRLNVGIVRAVSGCIAVCSGFDVPRVTKETSLAILVIHLYNRTLTACRQQN